MYKLILMYVSKNIKVYQINFNWNKENIQKSWNIILLSQ